MKYSLTLGVFLGLISKEAAAVRIQHHHHHHQQSKHHQRLAQNDAWVDDCNASRNPFVAGNPNGAGTFEEGFAGRMPGVGIDCQGFAQLNNKDDAWIDDCNASRNPFVAGNPNGAGTFETGQGGRMPGVGLDCQGFSKKRPHSLAQDDAWIDDCQPGRNPLVQADGQAGTGGSYPGVGVECQGFAQKKAHDAWIDDCSPGRNPTVQATGQAGTQGSSGGNGKGSYEGVGVECQGFNKKRPQSLAQDDAWIDDCSPGRDPTVQATGQAGTQGAGGATDKGSFEKVGVDCQGFAQRGARSLAQQKDDAWIDDCQPGRNPLVQADGQAGTGGSYPGVGVECQGFAQKKAHSFAQQKDDAWIDDCQPGRNPLVQADGQAGTGGSYPGVGVECQGFAQKKAHSLAQQKDDAWIDDCQPGRNPLVQADGQAGTGGSYPGVGVECQGFAQKNVQKLAQLQQKDDAWIDDCSAGRDPWKQETGGAGTLGSPSALPTGSYEKVGVECQGFAQKKAHNLAQQKDDAWIDDCNADRNPLVAGNPNGAGTWEEGQKGSYPGVGVECQGFAQKSNQHKKKIRKHHYNRN